MLSSLVSGIVLISDYVERSNISLSTLGFFSSELFGPREWIVMARRLMTSVFSF